MANSAKERGHCAQRFTGAVGAAPDYPAMRGLAARRATHCVRYPHCVQTSATKVFTNRAAREAARPVLPGAPEARCAQRPRAFAGDVVLGGGGTHTASRQAVPGGGNLWGAEEHSPGGGARSALRHLTRRACPSEVNAVRVASCATHPLGEHRRAVDAKRDRPSVSPHRVPPAATRVSSDQARHNHSSCTRNRHPHRRIRPLVQVRQQLQP